MSAQITSESLPKRKWNSPIAKLVCWQCKKSNVTLMRLTDAEGKKTPDYACKDCWAFGLPPIENTSKINYEYEK